MATKTPKEIPDTPIGEFMKGCRTKGTGYSYRSGILLFLDVTYGGKRSGIGAKGQPIKGNRATKEEFQEYEKLASRYIKEKRNHSADMIAFIQHMNEKKTPTKTISVKVQGVREFFIKNRIALDDFEKREIKKVLPRKARRETNFDFMTVDKIQAILPHLDIRMQALMLCLTACGARIGEVLGADLGDLHLDETPASLFVRDTKTTESRKVYLTKEASIAIKRWLSVRDKYIIRATNQTTTLGHHKERNPTRERRIFPFERTAVYRAWDRALIKSGLFQKDPRTDRQTLSIHRLRAFFRSTIAPKIGVDAAELLLGHSDEYDNTYRDLHEEELARKYLQCEEILTVSDNQRIKHDLEAQSEVLVKQSAEVDTLRQENKELHERLNHIETMQATLGATKARAHADPRYAELNTRLERMEAELKKK